MDATAKSMSYIIEFKPDMKQVRDAVITLIGILPSLDEDDVKAVISSMTHIITFSNNNERRSIAQQVLLTFKTARS